MTYEDMYADIFELVGRVGARPDVPTVAEEYFARVVTPFATREACRQFLERHIPELYRSFAGRPKWILEPEWPWSSGKPMIFVGSIDAPSMAFYSEARFFVFWNPDTGETNCIIQTA